MAHAVILIGLMAAALTACGSAHRAATTAPRVKDPAPALHPPGPIPGYLLIADRGNNRMLLVDSTHHIFWRYPGGGRRAMPFVFGDDTFFGPTWRETFMRDVGARARVLVVAASLAAGLVVALATIPDQSPWLHVHRDHHDQRDRSARAR